MLRGLELPWNQAGVERQRKAIDTDRCLPNRRHRITLHQNEPVPPEAGRGVKKTADAEDAGIQR